MSTIEQRFWSKVDGGDVTTCWLWTASKDRKGYGRFGITAKLTRFAHRWAYEQLIIEVPDGLVLDHLCRNTSCVNPWHLQPVTIAVNVRRGRQWESEKTHCPAGHLYDDGNTYRAPAGHRECRICRRAATRRHAPAKREYLRQWRSNRKNPSHRPVQAEETAR